MTMARILGNSMRTMDGGQDKLFTYGWDHGAVCCARIALRNCLAMIPQNQRRAIGEHFREGRKGE